MESKHKEITKKQMKKILNKSTDILCGNLRVDRILRTLLTEEAIDRDDVTKINKKDTQTEKVQALLDILAESPVSSYKAFMSALEEIRSDLHSEVKAVQDTECDGNTDTKRRLDSTSDLKSNKKQKVDERTATASHSDDPPDDFKDYMDVEPDSDGHYTSTYIKAAKPNSKQLDDREDENYCMTSPVKGRAYILNNSHFPTREIKDRDRDGSDEDFINMKHLLKQLGYEIEPHQNLEAKDIRTTIKQFVSQFNDTDYMSAAVVLMSHGGKGYIKGTDESEVKLKEIQAELGGCSKLRGKPKLFFVQACRGNLYDDANQTSAGSENSEDMEVDADGDFTTDVPAHADMHIAYATTEGFLSLRNKIKGSWFIQAITEVFLKHAHEDSLDTLMNKVTQRVTRLKGTLYDPEVGNVTARQTPERVNRMTKALYFLPKYPPTY